MTVRTPSCTTLFLEARQGFVVTAVDVFVGRFIWSRPHRFAAIAPRLELRSWLPSQPVIGLVLLAVAALCALPMTLVRAFVGLALGWLIGSVTGWDWAPVVLAGSFVAYPFAMAVAAFTDVGPTRRLWMRDRQAVEPTDDEAQIVEGALAELRRRGAPSPARWAIWGEHPDNACVHGRSLLVGSEEVRSPLLLSVLAHEAGHLRGPVSDGRLVAAFSYLAPRQLPKVVRRAWILHARRREYRADAYAAGLGLGTDFAHRLSGWTALERHQWWWSLENSHPRIDRRVKRLLRRAAKASA